MSHPSSESTTTASASSGHDAPTDNDPPNTDYHQHSIHIVDDNSSDDFESCFSSLSIHSINILGDDESFPLGADTVFLPPIPLCSPIAVRRLAETYDASTASVFAHAYNGSMACTAHDTKLLFAYRPLMNSHIRLFDAGEHVHHPLDVGFFRVPTPDCENGGAPPFVFVRTYHTHTVPGIIILHSAISKQLHTSGYNMSSSLTDPGFIHFPHRLRRSQDVYVSLQPTSQRGGLKFTNALTLPTHEQHVAPLPSFVHGSFFWLI